MVALTGAVYHSWAIYHSSMSGRLIKKKEHIAGDENYHIKDKYVVY